VILTRGSGSLDFIARAGRCSRIVCSSLFARHDKSNITWLVSTRLDRVAHAGRCPRIVSSSLLARHADSSQSSAARVALSRLDPVRPDFWIARAGGCSRIVRSLFVTQDKSSIA
jgi:hypothetical protein